MRLALIGSLALLSACSNLSDIKQTYSELTTSSLVGTWVGQMQCSDRSQHQTLILTFKQSSFPLIADGQLYSKATRGEKTVYMTAKIEGEMSLGGTAHINERSWIVDPKNGWQLASWQGNRVSDNSIYMETCGTEVTLKRTGADFISELQPETVFSQHADLFKN